MRKLTEVRVWGPRLALLVAVALSFWLSPAPQGVPDQDYWGEYVQVAPGLGFVLNHDSQGYVDIARHPGQLLKQNETRQSRPLYGLLAAVVGRPLVAGLRLAHGWGLTPAAWPDFGDEPEFWGFYWGYVLLNALALLGSLLLLRPLVAAISGGRAPGWLHGALALVLAANPITKTFFWTAHQQLLAFFVPLFCLALALALRRRPPLGWPAVAALSLGLGLLPLAYGSFVLAGAALAFGLWRPGPAAPAGAGRWARPAGQLAVGAALFALPTLLWVALLRLRGVAYYNHETVRYHQLVWLPEALQQLPPGEVLALVARKLGEYVASLQLVSYWALLALGLLAATRWRLRAARPARLAAEAPTTSLLPTLPARALAWTLGCFAAFFALLGYYPERLAYTLLPLLLVLLAGLLPHWPPRYARPLVLAGAAGWYLYVLLSYGPFS